MHMSFWWGTNLNDFLFKGFNIKSSGGLAALCVGLSILAMMFEWLKLLQAKQRQKELNLRAGQLRSICSNESLSLLDERRSQTNITLVDRAILFSTEVFLWINLQFLSYSLMLVVMVYNGWMVVAILIGSAFGFFIFGPMLMKINLHNCQIVRDTFCITECGLPEEEFIELKLSPLKKSKRKQKQTLIIS